MQSRGFTLVELMITVAIIGILASIAVPNFVEMQYRAKRAEAPACVDGIKTAEIAYDAAFDQFLLANEHPSGTPSGKKPTTWAGGNLGFQTLGWQPDGEIRGSYGVITVPVETVTGGDFVATGVIDVDGDQVEAEFTATKSINVTFNNHNDTY